MTSRRDVRQDQRRGTKRKQPRGRFIKECLRVTVGQGEIPFQGFGFHLRIEFAPGDFRLADPTHGRRLCIATIFATRLDGQFIQQSLELLDCFFAQVNPARDFFLDY
jgi:hypothetical protein